MPKKSKDELESLGIGNKIQRLRKEKGMTVKDLGEKTGFSRSLISQIENNQISPPISTLMKISNALNVEIAYFFQDHEAEEKITIVRKDERVVSGRRDVKGNINVGYSYELLAHKKTHKHMEPFIVTFEPRERDEVIMFSHKGEEFHLVLEGEIEMITDIKDPVVLYAGDALYFDSEISHGFRALGEKPAKTVAVVFQKNK